MNCNHCRWVTDRRLTRAAGSGGAGVAAVASATWASVCPVSAGRADTVARRGSRVQRRHGRREARAQSVSHEDTDTGGRRQRRGGTTGDAKGDTGEASKQAERAGVRACGWCRVEEDSINRAACTASHLSICLSLLLQRRSRSSGRRLHTYIHTCIDIADHVHITPAGPSRHLLWPPHIAVLRLLAPALASGHGT